MKQRPESALAQARDQQIDILAGALLDREFFEADFATRTKPDGTSVTDVDLAVEELIRTELSGHVPGDEIYGEEAGAIAGSTGRRWIIDPIDGTTFFASGIPLFATLIAYEDEHGPAIGVIHEPAARRTIFAGRGLGCWIRNGQGADRRPVCPDDSRDRRKSWATRRRSVITELVSPGPGLRQVS